MFDRRRRRSLVALLAIVSLLLITVDFRADGGGPTGVLRTGVSAVVGPLQQGVAGVVRPVGELFGSIGQLGQLRSDNRRLRAELEELRGSAVSEASLMSENEQLRELLDMPLRDGLATTAARIVGRPPGASGWSALIDAGAESGVGVGMAVIAPDGLVGKVVEVSPSTARVELLTSPDARYVVRVIDTDDDALLSGQGSSLLELAGAPDTEIEPGMEIVTRSFAGSSIPDGIPLGVVGEQRASGLDGTRFSLVRPNVDVQRLDVVRIVLDAAELPELIDPTTGLPALPRPPVAPSTTDPDDVDGEEIGPIDLEDADADADADDAEDADAEDADDDAEDADDDGGGAAGDG